MRYVTVASGMPVEIGTQITDGTTGGGIGNIVINLSGLLSNTAYKFKAYANNSFGIGWGAEYTFTTGVLVGYRYSAVEYNTLWCGSGSSIIIENSEQLTVNKFYYWNGGALLITSYVGEYATYNHTIQNVNGKDTCFEVVPV
jgi:hypothetical protein